MSPKKKPIVGFIPTLHKEHYQEVKQKAMANLVTLPFLLSLTTPQHSFTGISAFKTENFVQTEDFDISTTASSSSTCSSSCPSSARDTRPRSDAPIVDRTRRGNKSAALSAALNEDTKAQALREVQADSLAVTSGAVYSSLVKTWAEFHRAWFGAESNPFPLTVSSIWAVAAMFKKGRYRGYPNYLSAAKDKHIEQIGTWAKSLKLAARKSTRSVLRGIGPGRQSQSLDVFEVHNLKLGFVPLVPGGPCNPGLLIEVSAFWLPREIEISLARHKHIQIDTERSLATLTLPASKTDTQALGCSRSWGCVCDGNWSKPCGFHSMQAQDVFLKNKFGDGVSTADNLPLFPTSSGSTCEKAAVVDTITAIASRLLIPTVDDEGNQLFGGHSLRVLGARHLASIGIELGVIMLIARWESKIIMRYVAEAPLTAVTEKYRSNSEASEFTKIVSQLRSEVASSLEFKAPHSNGEIDGLLKSIQDVDTRLKQMENSKGVYVVNRDTNIFHFAAFDNDRTSPEEWNTRCGWKFHNQGRYFRSQSLTANWKFICKNCLPLEQRSAKAAAAKNEDLESDISSASSSSSPSDTEE